MTKIDELTVKVNVEIDANAEEAIRRIVREEIAAHEERPIKKENVTMGESDCLRWNIR